ncbi:MAG TPA: PQQ-binding-like beta-propeller repeat protein [Solirubrobacteraceae bacterium]|jgi:outer membrane protein assembly factor BamB
MPEVRRIITAIAVVAAAAGAVAPAAQAAATLTVSPATAPPGTPVRATGAGFAPGQRIDVAVDRTAAQYAVTSVTGTFTVALPLPASIRPGSHQVTAASPTGDAAGRAFTVSTPWAQRGFDGRQQSFNPYENQLTAARVADLDEAWVADTGTHSPLGQAVAAGGRVFIAAGSGKLFAYRAACGTGGADCRPLWTAQLPHATNAAAAPIVSGAVVFMATADGDIWGYRTSCRTDGGACTPVYKARAGGAIVGGPTLAGTRLYVGSGDGRVSAFPVSCSAMPCAPVWSTEVDGPVWTQPSVVNGVVYAGTRAGTLYAFSTADCADGDCGPLMTGSSGTGGLAGTLPVANGRVFTSGGRIAAFSTACRRMDCAPVWTAADRTTPLGGLTTAANGVFWANGEGGVGRAGQSCAKDGSACPITRFNQSVGGYQTALTTVAADVLYAVDTAGRLSAYSPTCQPGSGLCPALWTQTAADGGFFYSTPVVSDGTLYAGTQEGRLHAYTIAGVAAGTTP